jgi:hypothetical protein
VPAQKKNHAVVIKERKRKKGEGPLLKGLPAFHESGNVQLVYLWWEQVLKRVKPFLLLEIEEVGESADEDHVGRAHIATRAISCPLIMWKLSVKNFGTPAPSCG